MSLICKDKPVRVGVLTDEPLRKEGFSGIFEDQPGKDRIPLSPVYGALEELLSDSTLKYLIVDLNFYSIGEETVKTICRRRPEMRLIVIGPEGNDDLVMDLIRNGARAYLDLKASPQRVREAIEEVIQGMIWAPRRLLCALIDRLIGSSADTSLTNHPPRLTDRERQVLELILMARSNREIARQLGIEEHTVQAYVGRLMRKTGAENRIDLFMRASNASLLQATGILGRRVARRQPERHQTYALNSPLVTH